MEFETGGRVKVGKEVLRIPITTILVRSSITGEPVALAGRVLGWTTNGFITLAGGWSKLRLQAGDEPAEWLIFKRKRKRRISMIRKDFLVTPPEQINRMREG